MKWSLIDYVLTGFLCLWASQFIQGLKSWERSALCLVLFISILWVTRKDECAMPNHRLVKKRT